MMGCYLMLLRFFLYQFLIPLEQERNALRVIGKAAAVGLFNGGIELAMSRL